MHRSPGAKSACLFNWRVVLLFIHSSIYLCYENVIVRTIIFLYDMILFLYFIYFFFPFFPQLVSHLKSSGGRMYCIFVVSKLNSDKFSLDIHR